MTEAVNTGGVISGEAPEGHDAAMIAKVEEKEAELANNGQDAPVEEPKEELLLGKFKSAEDLAKAYQELEKKLGSGGDDKVTDTKADLEADPTKATDEQVTEIVEGAGLELDNVAEHYYANGALSDEHYEALEKAGIGRQYVDQYLAGVEAQASQTRDQIMGEVGGQEQFDVMAQWAAANMTEAELDEYNKAVGSRDAAAVRSAVMALAFRYQKEAGKDPNLVGGNGGGKGGGFESLAQLTEAMKDPRYEKDPAYRKSVQDKLSRSNIM